MKRKPFVVTVLLSLPFLLYLILKWEPIQWRNSDTVIRVPLPGLDLGLDNDNSETSETVKFRDPSPSPDVVSHQVHVEKSNRSDEGKKIITLGFENKSKIIVTKESTVHATQPLCSVNSRVDGDIMKYGRLNQTYVEEQMSMAVTGLCVCRDVVCSNFLTDNDWKQWNSCIGKGKSKLRNVIPKCRFQDGSSRPFMALKSFPGSGNTWVRQLLEESTGICTGSVYCDGSYLKSGMVGEGITSSSVLVVKTHYDNARQDRILIIRHPVDAILAYWKWTIDYEHSETLRHTDNPPARYFGNYSKWNNFVTNQISYWKHMIQNELQHSKKNGMHHLLVVRYEDIKKNVSNEVFRMLDFLKVDYSPDEVLNRLKHDLTAFKRPKPPRDFDPYTPEQRQKIKSTLQSFVQWLTANHHEDSLEWIRDYLE